MRCMEYGIRLKITGWNNTTLRNNTNTPNAISNEISFIFTV